MSVLAHAVISLTLGSLILGIWHSLYGFLAFLLSGVLIDMDHYFDYIREKRLSLDLKRIHATCKDGNKEFKKITLFIHSYEIILILWVLIFLLKLNIVWISIASGLTVHILLDQIFNPVLPMTYFFTYRLYKRFETKLLFQTIGGEVCSQT